MIESINKKTNQDEICSEHNVTLLYFCNTCNESLCSDCYMFGGRHKEHDIQKLDNIYMNHIDLIKHEFKGLQTKYDQLDNHLKLLNEKIIFVRNYKLERSNELEEFFDSLRNKLETVMHNKLSKLMSSKNTVSERLKYLECIKNSIEKELADSAKSLLISKSSELINSLKDLNIDGDLKPEELNVTIDVPSDIYPPYDCSTFEIKEYKKYIGPTTAFKNAILYSPELITNGLKWRLKVYPNGNGANANGEYISIFLELIEGLYETSKYFYKIELCMPDKPGVNYTREFTSDFQNGECWGYNRFYRIEALEREGFIDKNGSIQIKFYVRPQTYTQLARDQKNYINNLEKKLQQVNKVDQDNILRSSEEIAVGNFNMINNLNNVDPVNEAQCVGVKTATIKTDEVIQEEAKENLIVSAERHKGDIFKEPQDVEDNNFDPNKRIQIVIPRENNNIDIIQEENKHIDLGLLRISSSRSKEVERNAANLLKNQNAYINPHIGGNKSINYFRFK
jgi:tripartite motif-containing protein 37